MDTEPSIRECPCVGCGYDLRNLPIDGPCPECGRPIAESLGGRRLAAADSQWLTRLTIGQSLVAWGLQLAVVAFCLMPLLGILYGIVRFVGGIPDDAFVFVFALLRLVLIGGTALVWIGAILVTTPDPSESGAESAHSSRRIARWGMAASMAFIFLAVVVRWLPISVNVRVLAGVVLPLLAAVSVMVGISALLSCLAGRGSRIPDHELVHRTQRIARTLRLVLPIFLIAMFLAFASLPIAALTAPIQAMIGLAGVVVGCVVLFLLARLSTSMGQYRRAFHAARDESRAARM